MKSVTGICLYCQKPIKSGRSDKKFCDSSCKDAFYNDLKTKEHAEIRTIDHILKRNRRVLKKIFHPSSEKLTGRETFIKAGFEFGYHTHVIISKIKSNAFTFCYDYGYREVEPGKFKVIKSFTS